jgi:hypothetical protein
MNQYLIAAMGRDIDVLNDEMKAAGVRVFVVQACARQVARGRCGFRPMVKAHHLRAIPGDQGARGRFLGAGSR